MGNTTNAKTDIKGLDDIKLLVDTFYALVQKDSLLSPIFNAVIQDKWDMHLNKMYKFWDSILFSAGNYNGRPFPPHAKLPIEKEHFDKWLYLFEKTISNLFEGDIADQAKFRANKMAELFQIKLSNIKNDKFKPLI